MPGPSRSRAVGNVQNVQHDLIRGSIAIQWLHLVGSSRFGGVEGSALGHGYKYACICINELLCKPCRRRGVQETFTGGGNISPEPDFIPRR